MKWFIIISIFCTSTAFAVDFTYTRAMTYTDGSVVLIENIRSTRMYCDGDDALWVAGEPGADGTLSDNDLLGPGVHSCYVAHTTISSEGGVQQGGPSNTIIFGEVVEFTIGAPTDFAVIE